MQKRTALISVFHKEGIVDFAKELSKMGWDIIASGGTAKALIEGGVKVKDVAELVGGGAILDHRVVTLSREIHAGLLARYDQDSEEMQKLGIPYIDLVCVDLYPLAEAIKKPGATQEEVIEMTDIGGPTMLRSAAKGRRIVIGRPEQRQKVLDWLSAGEPEKEQFITDLVADAEAVVSNYVLTSARYHGDGQFEGLVGTRISECKYGENAWQTPAALYFTDSDDPLALDKFEIVAGTAPSYNNYCDVDRLLQTATHIAAGYDVNFGKVPFLSIAVKHGNACGASVGENKVEVAQKTIEGDLRAVFGGLVLLNFEVNEEIAEILLSYKVEEGRRILDGIIAPSFTKKAVEMLSRKGDKCRFLANPALKDLGRKSLDSKKRIRYVRGGFLAQPNYEFTLNLKSKDIEKIGDSNKELEEEMILAWAISSTSNSNTITLTRDNMLIGNGVGQQDRVGGCKLAILRAEDSGHPTKGAVAASDSFFPFTDGPETLIKAGVKAIFATSGSVRDEDVKEICKKNKVTLYMVPDSLGRGFFGH